MLIDARQLAAGTTGRADVCVIGAGAAGITLAMELLDRGRSVLLVESGGDQIDAETTDLYAGESVGQPLRTIQDVVALESARLRFFGGTTNHWAGACRPLRPIDFEERDHLRVSGWPIRHDDLLSYWERATEWVRISDATFDPVDWAARLGIAPPIVDTITIDTVAFQVTNPTRFGSLYGPDLAAAESVTVWQHANLVNLATTDGRTIDRADLRTLDGVALQVEADAYVLATGGIENARLLLASTDADPAGIGNSHDQVGRHFTEHLQIYAGFGLLDASPADIVGFAGAFTTIPAGRHEGFEHGVKFALALTDDHVRAFETTGLEIQLAVEEFPESTWRQTNGVDSSQMAALLEREGRPPMTAVYLQGLAEQELDPESRVTLGEARDDLGMRRTRLDWRYGAADRRRVLAGLRAVANELGALGLGRLQLLPGGVGLDLTQAEPDRVLGAYVADPESVDVDDFPIGVGFHHMCTTRMSDSPANGVVDADCRVHDVDNLWIGGSSVFGTGGVATPTFTIVALAIRLADHLDEVLG